MKTQEMQDSNKQVKMRAVLSLQQLLRLIDAKDFTGTVAVEVQAKQGLAGKIKTRVEEFREPN